MSYHPEMEGLLDHQLSFSEDEIDSTFSPVSLSKDVGTSQGSSNGTRHGNGPTASTSGPVFVTSPGATNTINPSQYSIQNDDTELLMTTSGSTNTHRNDTDDIVNVPEVESKRRNLKAPLRQISLQQYQKETETLDTIKCMVSSVLFFGIVALVIIVAFTINPEL